MKKNGLLKFWKENRLLVLISTGSVLITVLVIILPIVFMDFSSEETIPVEQTNTQTNQIGDPTAEVAFRTALPDQWLGENRIPMKKGWSFSVKTYPVDHKDVEIRVVDSEGIIWAIDYMKRDFHFKKFPADVDLAFDFRSLTGKKEKVIVRQFP